MNQQIQSEHKGIVITYDDHSNQWKFTLRGRDRSCESLAKARETIDKPVTEKAKPFAKIPAWEIWHNDTPSRVDVTGVGEHAHRRNVLCVWIKDAAGNRRKEDAEYRIYPSNEANDAIAEQLAARKKEIEKLEDECRKLRHQLAPLVIQPE